MQQNLKRRLFIGDGVFILLGSVLFGIGISLFAVPAAIAPGGITGLAVMMQHLFGAPVGVVTVLCNLPLLAAAFFLLGRPFFWRSIAGIAASSVMIDLAVLLPPFAGDRLAAAVFGGVLCGAGVGLIYMRGGSTGGTEIAASLIRRRTPHVSLGNVLLAVDGGILLLSAFVFRDMNSALYGAVFVFLTAQVVDRLVYGGQTAKMVWVVTTQWEPIRHAVLTDMRRGITVISAVGGYTDTPKRVLMCAVSPAEVSRLKTIVRCIDPDAFLLFTTADEIHGNGFPHPR